MKIRLQSATIAMALAFSAAGCDPAEPQPEPPAKEELPTSGLGPPSPPAPVVPSPTPALPDSPKAAMEPEPKKGEAMPEEKKADAPPK